MGGTVTVFSEKFPLGTSGQVILGDHTLGSNLNLSGNITAANLSGTNTGDLTLAVNNGLGLVGQVLNLGTPSDVTSSSINSVTTNTHTHAFTGQLSVAKGGTALSSLGSANSVLGVSASGTVMEYKTITPTANQVSVTHGVGTITLATPQDIATSSTPTFVDVFSSALNVNEVTRATDTGEFTGVPFAERGKFKVAMTYSAPNVVATVSFVGANTSFSYYINNKKFTVTAAEMSAYAKTATAAEGVWFFYISKSTTTVGSPVLVLSQTAWNISNGDVLLWDFYFNATSNTITWVGEERHTAGRDIYLHDRLHVQGAIYGGNGLLLNQNNNLSAFGTDTTNNFSRAMYVISGGSVHDEDIENNIVHSDAAYSSTTASPSNDWNLNVNQFLGFTAINSSTTAGTLTFPTPRTLVTGQAITVVSTVNTVRGTFTVTTGATGTSFAVTTVTGSNAFANGDTILVAGRFPIYYLSSVAPYVWRKLTTTDFPVVMAGAGATTANIATGTCQYNNSAAGGFLSVTSTRYFPMFLAATNMTSEPVICICGQGQSTNATLATALSESPFQFQNLVGLDTLGIQEIVPFYRLAYQYNSGVTFNGNRARLSDATFIKINVTTATGSIIGGGTTSLGAANIFTDTTNFNKLLTTSETTAQLAFDKIDDYAVSNEGIVGGQTIIGGTLTGQSLTLRGNAADLTSSGVIIADTNASALTVAGGMKLGGGYTSNIVTKTNSDYALTSLDYTVLFSTGASPRTATLPDATTIKGQVFFIKKTDSGAGTVVIATTSSQTVDGAASGSRILYIQNACIRVQSDGANWVVLTTNQRVENKQVIIDGQGFLLSTGTVAGIIEFESYATVIGWRLRGDATGSIVVDVYSSTLSGTPTTMISSGTKPSITTATYGTSGADAIVDWTVKSFAAGDIAQFNIVSVTTFTNISIILRTVRISL